MAVGDGVPATAQFIGHIVHRLGILVSGYHEDNRRDLVTRGRMAVLRDLCEFFASFTVKSFDRRVRQVYLKKQRAQRKAVPT
jgi:hypothetical protein